MKKIYDEIKLESAKYNIDKIVLFGSRARGDNKPKSDVDIAVYGELSDRDKYEFDDFIKNETSTLLEFDIVFVDNDTSHELIRNIDKDGVVLYEKV